MIETKGTTTISPQSRTDKAGLSVSVNRVHHLMQEVVLREEEDLKIGEHAPVFLAAVLEYLVAEILRRAGIGGGRNIDTKHLRLAAKSNEELGRLLAPHINAIENEETNSESENAVNNLAIPDDGN